jgi:hypothetical protein
VLQPLDDRVVPFDYLVHDLVEDLDRASPEPVRLALHPLTHLFKRGVLSVADRNDKVLSHESVYLAELDALFVAEITRRLEHSEKGVAVTFELGPLMSLDRIIDRQFVQLELPGDGDELFLRRLVEGDPGEPVGLLAEATCLLQRTRRGPATPSVDGAISDHASLYAGTRTRSLQRKSRNFAGDHALLSPGDHVPPTSGALALL